MVRSGGGGGSGGDGPARDPWTARVYPRHGDGLEFERVAFLTDAVYAIAVTLIAVGIGIPALGSDAREPAALWGRLRDELPPLIAFAVSFVFIASYWRANHRLTGALRAMSARYVGVILCYLAFIAVLPFPAGLLGEYPGNPAAVTVFAVVAGTVSALEAVLLLVADRDGLLRQPLSRAALRRMLLGWLAPVACFVVSIPVAYLSTAAAIALWFAGGLVVGRFLARHPPDTTPGRPPATALEAGRRGPAGPGA